MFNRLAEMWRIYKMHIKLLEVNPQIVRSRPTGRVLDGRLNIVEEKMVNLKR